MPDWTGCAALSLDLDNLWSYLRNAGTDNWRTFPSFLDRCVPRILDYFAARPEGLTVFIVGLDAAHSPNRDAFAAIGASRFDLGNHSYHHDAVSAFASRDAALTELRAADSAIKSAAGRTPSGYRAPGYARSKPVFEASAELGYRYDSSVLPSSVTPIVAQVLLMRSALSRKQRRQRRAFIGKASDVFFSLRPFAWETSRGRIYELPITTAPVVRLPFHMSYLFALQKISQQAALQYFKTCVALCRSTGVEPNFVLHARDFLGDEDTPELREARPSGLSATQKLSFISRCLDILSSHYKVMDLATYSGTLETRSGIPTRTLTD